MYGGNNDMKTPKRKSDIIVQFADMLGKKQGRKKKSLS